MASVSDFACLLLLNYLVINNFSLIFSEEETSTREPEAEKLTTNESLASKGDPSNVFQSDLMEELKDKTGLIAITLLLAAFSMIPEERKSAQKWAPTSSFASSRR